MDLKIGDKVHYIPFIGVDKELYENGVIKSHSDNLGTVFVVFKCADDWKNYQNYTGQSTPILQLKDGWI